MPPRSHHQVHDRDKILENEDADIPISSGATPNPKPPKPNKPKKEKTWRELGSEAGMGNMLAMGLRGSGFQVDAL